MGDKLAKLPWVCKVTLGNGGGKSEGHIGDQGGFWNGKRLVGILFTLER